MSLLYQCRLFLPKRYDPVPLFHGVFFIYTQSGEKARFIKKIHQKILIPAPMEWTGLPRLYHPLGFR